MKKKKEPAEKNYFFGDSYLDLINTIIKAFALNKNTIKTRLEIISDTWLLDGFVKKIAKTLMNLCAVVAICVFGTFYTVLLSAVHIVCLLVVMVIFYVLFIIVWFIDHAYLLFQGIAHMCPKCKRRFLFPAYMCPHCGKFHWHLTSGVYGTIKRKCNCGYMLPTTFLIKVNGVKRSGLKGTCPFCLRQEMAVAGENFDVSAIPESEMVTAVESYPIPVPIGGGRSSGKSVFINAFVYSFVERSVDYGFESDPLGNPYNKEMKDQYKRIRHLFMSGSSERTEVAEAGQVSVRDFSFYVNHKKFPVARLIHMLDVDGESFVKGTENEMLLHFQHCKGVILIVDPFTIPGISVNMSEQERRDSQSISLDQAGMDTLDIVLDSYITKIKTVLAQKATSRINLPIFVCIGKIDMCNLEQKLGRDAIEFALKSHPELYKTYEDAMSGVCRNFLCENGELGFVERVENQFVKVQYFAFSAIGHPSEQGPYQPQGVMRVMESFLTLADGGNTKTWKQMENLETNQRIC